MTKQARDMRWGVEKRLEFIEFRLFWEGGINRSEIMEQFGVSVPQASKDLSQYQEEAPGNLIYDKSEKRYLISSTFEPVFFKPDADHYLTQLELISNKTASREETWLSSVPDIDSMPVPHRRVDVAILKPLLRTIYKKRSVEILYQSMSPKRPEPEWRWISPHALGSDGFRWHARSYCHESNKFKDFLLSRILDVRNNGEQGAPAEDDKYWNET